MQNISKEDRKICVVLQPPEALQLKLITEIKYNQKIK